MNKNTEKSVPTSESSDKATGEGIRLPGGPPKMTPEIERSLQNSVIAGGQKNLSEKQGMGIGRSLPAAGRMRIQEILKKRYGKDIFNNFSPTFEYDEGFLDWLAEVKHGLAISLYKFNYVFSLGTVFDSKEEKNKLSLWMTHFERPMGLCLEDDQLLVGSAAHLWQYFDHGPLKEVSPSYSDFTNNYFPRRLITTNGLEIHDIVVDKNGEIYFCSPKFNCVCTTSKKRSFTVYWKPPWISKIAPADCCHLNGLCCRDGIPRYITSVSQDHAPQIWKIHRENDGIVWDIVKDELVCNELSMPHSPRWHQEKLWVLESGRGYLGYVDFETKTLVHKVFIPGFARGLTFISDKYAVVGSSLDRHERVFSDLPLGEGLKKRDKKAQCGIFVIDLEKFEIIHKLQFYRPIMEAYDVISFPGSIRPRVDVIDDGNARSEYFVDGI